MQEYTIDHFVEESEKIVRENESDTEEILRGIRPRLSKLLLESKISEEYFVPRKDRYAMNLIRMPRDKIFSVTSGVWNPGQTTPIHDHLTWALVGIYRGKERESIYKRCDDGQNSKIARLELQSELTNYAGHVTVLGERGIHKVDNIFQQPAYSIHVYGRDIGNVERHSYDPQTGSISSFKSGYCNVLRDTD